MTFLGACANVMAPGTHGGECRVDDGCDEGLLCSPDRRCVPWDETPCGQQPCAYPGQCVLTVDWETLCLCPEGMHPVEGGCFANEHCAEVTCSGHGTCIVWAGGTPICDCDPGWHEFGLHCIANDPDTPCLGWPCDGHWGRCVSEDGEPRCECDPVAELAGQTCVPRGVPSWSGGVTEGRPGDVIESPPRLTFDASTQEAMLFIGSHVESEVETWRWDGAGWQEVPTSSRPSPRGLYAVAFDPTRRRHVLFGGRTADRTLTLDETWVLEAAVWSQVDTATRPSPRLNAILGWDPDQAELLLHGGWSGGSALGDTWRFDGSDWQEVTTGAYSPALETGSLVWDPVIRRMVLVGEQQDPGAWRLEGDGWQPIAAKGSVITAVTGAAAFDHRRSRLLYIRSSSEAAEAWVVQDGGFLQESSVPDSVLGQLDLLWVPSLETLLLVGIRNRTLETWTYDWQPRWPAESCDNEVDDDHDGYVDCADPECEDRPCLAGQCVAGVCLP